MQPSAQGIASLFMGNPGALAARVDQDRKQSPMGIPDDLRQLMALNIVTNETDAAKRQQAMNELQQMAPNGQPPTVAESLRQQAVQKLQARMVQEQQKQQALQQMVAGLPAAGVPANVPQPQGIDQAPVEFGMASGGIVSFNGEGESQVPRYETPYDRMTRENREEAKRAEEERIAAILASGNESGAVTYGEQMRRLGQAIDSVVPDPVMLFRRLVSDPSLSREKPQKTSEQEAEAPVSRGASQMTPQQMERFVKPSAPTVRRAPPAAGLPAAIPERIASEAKAAPAQPAAPEFDESITYQGVLNQADAARLKRQAEYEEKIGKPRYEALDKLMAEYERQKAEAATPTGMAGLIEFMSQIAATPRGMSSLEAGAAGARGAQALEAERKARRAGLTEKQIELEQKRIDADRQYAKEVLGVGDAQYDRALKANLSLFEEQGKNKRQAMSDAAALTREQFRADSEKEAIKIRAQYQQQLQAMPSAEERLRKQAMDAYKAKFPGADDYTAMQALGLIGAKGGYESAATALRAATSTLEDMDSTPEEKAVARQTRNAILQGMRPGAQGGSKPTTKEEYDKLPKGSVYTAPDGSQRVKG